MGDVGPDQEATPAEPSPAVELVASSPAPFSSAGRKVHLATVDGVHVVVRVVCLVTSVVALSLMVTAKQASTLSLYGLELPLYSKWSFSDSFEYLVGVSGAVVAHSLLQLLISLSRLWKKALIIPSRRYAWVIFAGDQNSRGPKLGPEGSSDTVGMSVVFAYAMMSAASAASGVTSLNRTGIQHTALPNFCKPLRAFCDRVGASIAFAFLSCFLLATSAVLDVLWLTCY